MALNKTYWDYAHAQSDDWSTYGIKYADKQIYANPNFSWGNLDYSFPTSFRKRNITKLVFSGNGQSQACETIADCLIYNSMIAYSGSGATGSFYKDNNFSYCNPGSEGFFPVIDIDTHDFAYKMTLRIFTSGNWVTVNAVDFVNNYDSYAANVYGYINNYMSGSSGRSYAFCNYYVTPESQFSVHANIYGYRTSGYGSINEGGHAVSGQTAWSNRSIWQLAATTAGNYSNLSYPANAYFPFEIPELNGQSWNAGSEVAPDAIITGGTYTNHAVLVYSDQRVYMPLKHILKDIIVNCGLVLLDSEDNKWISMVDANGLCQDKLVLLSSDEAKESSIYNTRTSDNNLNPSPTPPSPGPGTWDDMPGAGSSIGALAGARCYICSKTDITNLKNWMSKTEADGGPPDGYDVLSSLISVMAFPIDMTPASSGPATAISFTGLRTATDNQLVNIATALLSIANSVGAVPKTEIKTFTSTATALPSAGNPFTIDLGTCDCPTFYSSDFPFADYDASVELYLPFIGTMSLDTQTVMGKSLHAYMSVDPITGAIYAWCECTKDGSRVVVASGTGAIGVNTPITANQVGMAMAQIKNNAAQTRQTAIQSALTLGVGAFAGMDKNISSVLSRNMTQAISQRSANIAFATGRDYMDALSVGASQAAITAIPNAIGANLNSGRANRQIAQANHNSISGSAGGSTADWSCSYIPYLKVITPDIHRAGEQYEHTYGVPTVQSGTLSSFSGLTFCANPDVSSISTATDQEKQQIFGLLTGGVYV